jgi:hypothetical protein
MSQQLISRSPDLKRLRDEGFGVEVLAGFLLIRDVPYVNQARAVKRGVLVSTLELANDVTAVQDGVIDHTLRFAGEVPCDSSGRALSQIINASSDQEILPGLTVNHNFSSKPAAGYKDYFEKVSTYVAMLEGQAQLLEPGVTAKTFPLVVDDEEADSVFRYMDTASSRADITAISEKLKQPSVAIVGLGGTGSYVLDFLAKTPVKEIHLFDGDRMQQHNAFRVPGALSGSEISSATSKVAYHRDLYSKLRTGLFAHEVFITEQTVEELREFSFVFLCLDDGGAKKLIVDNLETWRTPFIDVGMGIYKVENSLAGMVRTTLSSESMREHVRQKNRIPFISGTNEYSNNIQIAELNALNAALAIIRWKKFLTYYNDLEHEHFSIYEIDGNTMLNEDLA